LLLYYKVRKDSKVVNKCVYSVLGIDEEGKKDILGIWIGENESAAFWTTIFNELRRLVEYIRVMKDNSIIIVLKGGIQIREPIETNN
jgi:transposase-like protein